VYKQLLYKEFMPLHAWLTFITATFFISGTPGPNMLKMLDSGIRHGLRETYYTMAGCLLAVFILTAVSAAGVGTLLASSPFFFEILRTLGAGYLVIMGVRTMSLPVGSPVDSPLDLQATVPIPPSATPEEHFKSGLKVGLSNPKLLLFATAFFPQFIGKSGSELLQFGILLASFTVIEVGWYFVYAFGGSRLAKFLQREQTQRYMNFVIGTLFAGFGVLLFKWRPA
jgi:homoserine/homoserine lactone efflux protein